MFWTSKVETAVGICRPCKGITFQVRKYPWQCYKYRFNVGNNKHSGSAMNQEISNVQIVTESFLLRAKTICISKAASRYAQLFK